MERERETERKRRKRNISVKSSLDVIIGTDEMKIMCVLILMLDQQRFGNIMDLNEKVNLPLG